MNYRVQPEAIIRSLNRLGKKGMGMWSKIKKIAKKVGNAVGGAISSIINVAGEILGRLVGLPGFLLDIIFGPFIRKRLRLQFFVLKNENGTPLHASRDLIAECENAYFVVKSVLDREANIRVTPYGSHPRVKVIDEAPPTAALEPACGGESFKALFGAAGSFFRKHKQWSVSILTAGYMAPISVFIVRDFTDDHNGCSVGTLADFVLVDLTGIEPTKGDDVGNATNPSTTPAHEVGHACGIQWMLGSEHHSSRSNLMFSSKDRGTTLTKAQMAVVRSSRFVSYF